MIDHMLRHIKYSHHDIEGVGDKSYGYKGLEDPFEEDPCFKVGKVIVVNDHLNQLVAGNECQDQACNRDNHLFGNIPDHGEDARRKVRRSRPHLRRNIANLSVYRIKQSRQLVRDTGRKYSL